MVHICLKPYCSFASFSFKFFPLVKLSVCLPLITEKIDSASITTESNCYRYEIVTIFLICLFECPINLLYYLIFISALKVSKTNSSVSLSLFSFIPCTRRQFLHEYCCCLSIFASKFSKWSWRVFILRLYYFIFLLPFIFILFMIKPTASVRSFS